MDPTQIILLAIIIVLAIFLVVLGFQVFFVLKDLRKTLGNLNQLFENTNDFVVQVKKPVESASNLFTAMTAGLGIAHLLKKVSKEESKDERSEK